MSASDELSAAEGGGLGLNRRAEGDGVARKRTIEGADEANRLYLLDGLRFAAALAVVLFHFTGRENPAWGRSVWEEFPVLGPITSYGGFGPYLFFMISGFVVLMSAWGRSVPAFIASRVGRLYPAYWFAVVLTAVLVYANRSLFFEWPELTAPEVALNLTMFQEGFGVVPLDGVYWTLWVELKFYILLGLMMVVGITRKRMLVLCLLWPLLGAMAAHAESDLMIAVLEPTYAPYFCIGILLYLIRQDGWSASAALLLAANCASALWVADTYYRWWTVAVLGAPLSSWGVVLLFALCVAAVVVATLTPAARLGWRWLAVLGALTYPLYLVHQAPGWLLIQALNPVLPKYAVLGLTIGLVLVLAYLVQRLVEVPFGPKLRLAVARDLAELVASPPVPAEGSPTIRWALPEPSFVPPVPPTGHMRDAARNRLASSVRRGEQVAGRERTSLERVPREPGSRVHGPARRPVHADPADVSR